MEVTAAKAQEDGNLVYLTDPSSFDKIRVFEFNFDGSQLVLGGLSHSVMIADMLSLEYDILVLDGHATFIDAVTFRSDGKQVASAGRDNKVKIWDAKTRALGIDPIELGKFKGLPALQTFTEHDRDVLSLSYNPAQLDRLASGDDGGTIYIWDVGEDMLPLPPDVPDVIAAEVNNEVNNNLLMSLVGHTGSISSIQYSIDGSKIASGSNDKSVRIWDANTGKELLKMTGHEDFINSISFSPVGRRVASCSRDGSIRIWDSLSPLTNGNSETDTALAVINDAYDTCFKVAFSPDGLLLASQGRMNDEYVDIIRIWDVEELRLDRAVPNLVSLTDIDGEAKDLVFHPNGQAVAFNSNSNVRMWTFGPSQNTMVPATAVPLSPTLLPVKNPVAEAVPLLPTLSPMSTVIVKPGIVITPAKQPMLVSPSFLPTFSPSSQQIKNIKSPSSQQDQAQSGSGPSLLLKPKQHGSPNKKSGTVVMWESAAISFYCILLLGIIILVLARFLPKQRRKKKERQRQDEEVAEDSAVEAARDELRKAEEEEARINSLIFT